MENPPPIPLSSLRDLFEHLDRSSMAGYRCDHSFALTTRFLQQNNLPGEPMIGWLGEHGAGCDCEVIFNVVPEWEEAVGYTPPDEDEA